MRSAFTLCSILSLSLLAPALYARPRAEKRDPARAPTLVRVEASRPAFHASCLAAAEGHDRARTEHALAAALDALERASLALDRSNPESELSLLDARAFERRVPCSNALWSALAAGLAAARESDGAYDPTDLPLTRAWAGAVTARPEPTALSEARALTGWRQLQLEPGARAVRFPRAGMALDLDGVGAGAALDQAVDSLRADGIRRVRLTLGDVTAVYADEGEPWPLSVPDPRETGRALVHLVARQGALATASSAPRRLDPRSGLPLIASASVTVVARSAARAQALARALLVMGREEAAGFAASRPDLGVLWLELDGVTVQAWRWNMPSVASAPEALVRWMD